MKKKFFYEKKNFKKKKKNFNFFFNPTAVSWETIYPPHFFGNPTISRKKHMLQIL